MTKLQFRVLYRQFLFRVVDLELLSSHAQGDARKILGQFAAVLIVASVWLSPVLIGLALSSAPGIGFNNISLVFFMVAQHFLIATTMLVVGLFAVLSWDSTFPDKRDVLVLAPLPVQVRTIFLAKVAAVSTSLGVTIILLHSAMGLVLPAIFAARAAPAVLPALTLDTTPVPVPARDMEAVMDRDLRQQLTTGELAPGTGAGLAIGVWKNGEQRVFTYGAAKPDSLFEIASISKTFTGLMLARMVTDGKVRLDEPVRNLLPVGTVSKPEGQEITLLDLTTHHSGLPPLPDNAHPADEANPYADYGVPELYAYVRKHGVRKPDDAPFEYSGLGVGLLGQALAERAGRSYPDLLREEITDPLGMTDTVLQLSADQQQRFLQGYDVNHRPVQATHVDGLAPAGAILSTPGDMLTYLKANLHPEKYRQLSGAFALSHRLYERAPLGQQIALAWGYAPDTGTYGHNGHTAGFGSYAFFSPRANCAAVVLMNSGPNLLLAPEVIAVHIAQRFEGEPAISLDTVVVSAANGFWGVVRSFGAYWLAMLGAGVFIYGSVLAVQGLAALMLPRRLFLRVSGYLQLAAFGLIVGTYFPQPGFGGLDDLAFGAIYRTIQWLPSYWFLGLFEQLNGSLHPALRPLAARAWIALAVVVAGTVVVYTLSYFRTLRKIVEEPDITPGFRGIWLPGFGNLFTTAVTHFSLRTLLRSRQHRLILAFYLGVGFAITTLFLKTPDAQQHLRGASGPLLVSTIVMMLVWVLGTRVVFSLPVDLRSNWIFRVTPLCGAYGCLAARRRSITVLAVAPAWAGSAILLFSVWPWKLAAGHLLILALLGLLLAELSVQGTQKIPFACSYLPGKSNFNITFFLCIFLLMILITKMAELEQRALENLAWFSTMAAALSTAAIAARWWATRETHAEGAELRFEEESLPEVISLGLTTG